MKSIINLIKKLRLETNASIIDCKKALIKFKNNFKKAKENLKYKLNIKNINIFSKITSKGIVISYIKNKYGSLIEINCETEFIINNKKFINFYNKLIKLIVNKKIKKYINKYYYNKNKTIKKKILELINYYKENIIIKKYKFFKTKYNLTSYVHNNKIGVILKYKGENNIISKNIAMHIAALQPLFISKKQISNKILKIEKKNIKNNIKYKIKNKNIKNNIKNKIINNYLNKYFQEVCLLNQYYIKNNKKYIFQILKKNNIYIKSFYIMILGKND